MTALFVPPHCPYCKGEIDIAYLKRYTDFRFDIDTGRFVRDSDWRTVITHINCGNCDGEISDVVGDDLEGFQSTEEA